MVALAAIVNVSACNLPESYVEVKRAMIGRKKEDTYIKTCKVSHRERERERARNRRPDRQRDRQIDR